MRRVDNSRDDALLRGQWVHQILFDDNRHSGVAAVNSSLHADGEVRQWEERLRPFYRLSGEPGTPREAFSYLVFDGGSAAVLRRVSLDGDIGRNFSHALVGPAKALAGIAMQLTMWRRWMDREDRDGYLDRINAGQLHDAIEHHETGLNQRARGSLEAVTALLAATLEQPRGQFSVIGVRTPDVVPTLWAVRDVTRAVLEGLQERRWTFSTFETEDSDRPCLPEFLFLPSKPPHVVPQSGRTRVDRSPSDRDPTYLDLARDLLDSYRHERPEKFVAAIRKVVRDEPLAAVRVELLARKRLGVALAPVPVTRSPAPAAPAPHVLEPPAAERPSVVSPAVPVPSRTHPLEDWLVSPSPREKLADLAHRLRVSGAPSGPVPHLWADLVQAGEIDRLLSSDASMPSRLDSFDAVLDLLFGVHGEGVPHGDAALPLQMWLSQGNIPWVFAQHLYERTERHGLQGDYHAALGRRLLAERMPDLHTARTVLPEPAPRRPEREQGYPVRSSQAQHSTPVSGMRGRLRSQDSQPVLPSTERVAQLAILFLAIFITGVAVGLFVR